MSFLSKIDFTSKSTWTKAHGSIICIENTRTTVETVRNGIITWIEKNFTKSKIKFFVNNSNMEVLETVQ